MRHSLFGIHHEEEISNTERGMPGGEGLLPLPILTGAFPYKVEKDSQWVSDQALVSVSRLDSNVYFYADQNHPFPYRLFGRCVQCPRLRGELGRPARR